MLGSGAELLCCVKRGKAHFKHSHFQCFSEYNHEFELREHHDGERPRNVAPAAIFWLVLVFRRVACRCYAHVHSVHCVPECYVRVRSVSAHHLRM